MKLALFLCFLLALLVGAGSILLRTSQAPFAALQNREPAPVPAPLNVSAPPPAGSGPGEAAEKKYTREEFRALGEAALAKLPGKESVGALKEADAFVAPLPILKAGEILRPLAEAVHLDAELSAEAILIYRTCAASGDYPDTVRALCLHNFRRLARKSGKPTPEGFAPAFIRELTQKLAT
jgi:hypothetical protein